MDENKVIRPMDFVRLTNIDELNVIKDTKNHIGLVKEVSRDGRMSIIWIGETYSQLAWFKSSELEVVDNLVSILTCGLANYFIRPKNVLKRARAFLRQDYQYMMFLSHYMGSFQ